MGWTAGTNVGGLVTLGQFTEGGWVQGSQGTQQDDTHLHLVSASTPWCDAMKGPISVPPALRTVHYDMGVNLTDNHRKDADALTPGNLLILTLFFTVDLCRSPPPYCPPCTTPWATSPPTT